MNWTYVGFIAAAIILIWHLFYRSSVKGEIQSLRIKSRWDADELNRLYGKRTALQKKLLQMEVDLKKEEERLSNIQKALEDRHERLNDRAALLEKIEKQVEHLTFDGWKHLCIMEERYFGNTLPPETTMRAVSVVVKHPDNPKCFVIVKNFWYDKYNHDDYKAARAKAEELLGIIKKS